MNKVRKAIIPAAGFGTRMLPATKVVPKELIPVVDKPVIQYVVEEAAASGITDILIVISADKLAIKEHFEQNTFLEKHLHKKGKTQLLEELQSIHQLANIEYVFQKEMNGLGDAVRYGKDFVGEEAFAVLLGDTILSSDDLPVTRQLINVYEEHHSSVVALDAIPKHLVSKYGVIDGKKIEEHLFKIENLIEKPPVEEAPSNLVIASRYVLTPEIFKLLETIPRGHNNEIQLTDAMRVLLETQEMYGLEFDGIRHDVGSKLGFIKTNIMYGLEHKAFKKDLKNWIRGLELE